MLIKTSPRTEATRLAGSTGLPRQAFRRELEIAFENMFNRGKEKDDDNNTTRNRPPIPQEARVGYKNT